MLRLCSRLPALVAEPNPKPRTPAVYPLLIVTKMLVEDWGGKTTSFVNKYNSETVKGILFLLYLNGIERKMTSKAIESEENSRCRIQYLLSLAHQYASSCPDLARSFVYAYVWSFFHWSFFHPHSSILFLPSPSFHPLCPIAPNANHGPYISSTYRYTISILVPKSKSQPISLSES